MNKKLLTDESLRDDLYCQLMFMAGGLIFYNNVDGGRVRDTVEKQLDLLMPVVKKHIKRHVKVAKESKSNE